MNMKCAYLVVLVHFMACVNSSYDLETPSFFNATAMINAWVFFTACVLGGSFAYTSHNGAPTHINHYVICICLSVICNSCFIHYGFIHVGYCFMIHSCTSIASALVVDNASTYTSKVLMFLIMLIIASLIHTFPVVMGIESVAFFEQHSLAHSNNTAFETSHLWAIIFTMITSDISFAIDWIQSHV